MLLMTRSNPIFSDYHLHGSDKLSPKLKSFVSIPALSAYVAEAAMAEMMFDARLVKSYDNIVQAMQEELVYLESLPKMVYERTVRMIGLHDYNVAQLQTDVLRCAHTQVAFL